MSNRKEIGVDLLGINALDPYFRHNSSPRKAMTATQTGQAPVIDGNEPRRILTGVEPQYAEATFDVSFPCDATVLQVIRKFQPGLGKGSIPHNPVTAILYEDYYDPHKTVGVILYQDYASYHQDFGFRYKRVQDNWDHLTPGATFAKGTRLGVSPAVKENDMYGYGLEAEVAFMSVPGTIEDGFVVSESFIDKMTPTVYNSLVANWGRKMFPLNLYGDDDYYKPFPDVGQKIREDGLVFALRDTDDDLSVADMTPRALREVDYTFDRLLYGKANAVVADINVYHDDKLNPASTPIGMDAHARKYYDAQCRFYQALLNEYNKLKKRRGHRLKITPEFNRLLVEAQIFLPTPNTPGVRKLIRMHRLEILDEWRVELTYEHKVKTGDGNKLTDMAGGQTKINLACYPRKGIVKLF